MTVLPKSTQKKIKTLRQLVDALTQMSADTTLPASERIKAAEECRLDLEFIHRLDAPPDVQYSQAGSTHDYS